jgi:hypothetical protein
MIEMKLKLTCKCGGRFESEHRYESYIRDRSVEWYAAHKDCCQIETHKGPTIAEAMKHGADRARIEENELCAMMFEDMTDAEWGCLTQSEGADKIRSRAQR